MDGEVGGEVGHGETRINASNTRRVTEWVKSMIKRDNSTAQHSTAQHSPAQHHTPGDVENGNALERRQWLQLIITVQLNVLVQIGTRRRDSLSGSVLCIEELVFRSAGFENAKHLGIKPTCS